MDEDVVKEFHKLSRKNRKHLKIIEKKINRLRENPYLSEPLGGNMKGLRSEHVADSYVLIFEIDEQRKVIRILDFDKHDNVYNL